MKTINRMVLTFIPRQPYIDWANSFDDGGATLDLEDAHATSILIPNSYDELNYEGFLKKQCRQLFEMELDAWMADPDVWPQERDYKTFMKWFKVVPSDAVFEMGKGPIRVEEY